MTDCSASLPIDRIVVGNDGSLRAGQPAWVHAHLALPASSGLTLRCERDDADGLLADDRVSWIGPRVVGSDCVRFHFAASELPGRYTLRLMDRVCVAVGSFEVAAALADAA